MNTPYDPFANINFDQVPEGDDSYNLIPNGEYAIRAVDMELKTSSKKGDQGNYGQMIAVQFEIIGPTHAGRKIFANFNIVNDNSLAVEIGLRELRAWMTACGKSTSGDMSMERVQECVGMEFNGRVGVQKSKDPQYDDQNKISKYKPHAMTAAQSSAPIPAADPAAAAPETPAPAADGLRPWERKRKDT